MRKWRVYYNLHKYSDLSDNARPASRIVVAHCEEDAREILYRMRDAGTKLGKSYIGNISMVEAL